MLRKATPTDVKPIVRLIEANPDKVRGRTQAEVRALLGTFWVIENHGELVGCCCLEVYSPKIAELRSLVVRDDCRGKGYGKLLVHAALEEATRRNIPQVLALTATPAFFHHLQFGPCLNEKCALLWNGGSRDQPAHVETTLAGRSSFYRTTVWADFCATVWRISEAVLRPIGRFIHTLTIT
jgi:amino-acid N-acetyltransferase